jgi:hypothetical protein
MGDLGSGEAHDLVPLVVAEVGVEIVEIPSRGSQDEDPSRATFHALQIANFGPTNKARGPKDPVSSLRQRARGRRVETQ